MRTRILAAVAALAALVVGLPAANAGAVTSGSLTWQAPRSIDPAHGGFNDVSCATATFCLAAGKHGSVMRYDGSSWKQFQALGDRDTNVAHVECASTTWCVASTVGPDYDVRLWTYDGTRWIYNPTTADYNAGLSCASRDFCMAVDTVNGFVSTRTASAGWTQQRSLPQGDFSRFSCAAANFCVALSDRGVPYRWDGTDWAKTADVAGAPGLDAVDCEMTTFCLAVGDDGYATTFDGESWTTPTQVDAGHRLVAVDCASPSRCVATDEAGRALDRKNGTWSAPVTVQARVTMIAISCPSSAFCAAVSRAGSAARQVDGTWQAAAFVNVAYGAPTAVSCGSASFCIAVDGSGALVRYDGTRWHQPSRVVADGAELTDVSCLGSGFCMATTRDGRAVIRSTDGLWSLPKATGLDDVEGVSCTSTTFCFLTGFGSENAVAWDGTTFVPHGAHGTYAAHFRPTCARAGYCFALAFEGQPLMRYLNGVWRQADWANTASTVDCVSSTFCLAIEPSSDDADPFTGTAYAYNGATERRVSPEFSLPYLYVSCGSATFCVAAESGKVSSWNGKSWSKIAAIVPITDRNNTINDVECRPAVCVATVSDGRIAVAR